MKDPIPSIAPRRPELERREDGQLWVHTRSGARRVQVSRCFPWSEPARYISLRDQDDEEVALVRDLDDLDEKSRAALAQSLLEAGFVLEVERVLDVTEEIEIRSFRVETRHGIRSFQTPRDEWPREMPGGGLLIRDVASDLFYIPDPEALDAQSRRHLWAFLD